MAIDFAIRGNGVAMVKLKNECGRGSFVRNVHWENLTGGEMGNGISAGRYGTAPSVNSCNNTGTIRFSNLTAKNIHVEDAVFSAFNVVGYKSPAAQQQFVGFSLTNFTVKKFKALGMCENAAVELVGDISPAFPPCTNSTPNPPPPPPKPSPPPAKHQCTIQTKNQRCFDDTASGSLLPVPEPSTHDKVTLEVCALACFDGNHSLAGIDAGNHCWCGSESDLSSAGARAKNKPLAECEVTPCHADKDQKCGGTGRLLVYAFKCSQPQDLSPAPSLKKW